MRSRSVRRAAEELGGIDVLVLHQGTQQPVEDVHEITTDQLERTFRTNVFSMFFMTKAVLKSLKQGGAIINTTWMF